MPSTNETPAAATTADHAAPAVPEQRGGFQVRLDNFEGPFDLLLGLIAKHRMDVTEVALSKVTDEFIAHIRAMGPDWDLDAATEFLVVASTLLDLKAARLLPAAEVEDEEDLALLEARDLLFARLLQYRAYKRAAAVFGEHWAAELLRAPRTAGLEPQHAALLPEVVITLGVEDFARLAARAMTPRPAPVVHVDHIHAPPVSVREQAALVVGLLGSLGEATFAQLVADAPDNLVVVARFLALLELYRERVLAFEQPEALGDLLVRWVAEADRAVVEVTDEFDRPPGEPGPDAGGVRGTAPDAGAAGPGGPGPAPRARPVGSDGSTSSNGSSSSNGSTREDGDPR
ncbi:segregation/condensation protein A [Kitasatospora indigofera]|uniref:Segregation and condensation protein A n=1 Tax=Kitasatospora indigofera TaxID=67307 RepID=A0A919L0F7_9ACTN|nr:segregation/condensation protein A [Kitasatospora indigofera]GHH80275.1 segregation/condensation protein A [Kitasatospora indigofera]